MIEHQNHADLKRIADELRIDILTMITGAGNGHPGGSLSAIDLLTVLFARHIHRTPENADDPQRDRFILSKGHGVPALYAVLARLGLIPHEELATLRVLGSRLQGHPHRLALPYLEVSSGSLGQGLSVAQGMAMAARLDGRPSRFYCMLGDGEFQEGQVWEALMSAPKFGLDNLIVILDANKGQIDGHVRDIMNIEPVADKARAFHWDVQEIDGHDIEAIDSALTRARALDGRPHFIHAHTVKGRGVSFMEDNIDFHGKAPTQKECDDAINEIRARIAKAS